MARARNIKPGFFKNEILGVADPLYSLLFEGLWVLADREGRLEDRPLRIKAEIFPYREGLSMDNMLDWLDKNGFIRRYTSQGKKCILVLEFVKHQNPHKNEAESELPAPDEAEKVSELIGTRSEELGSARADSLYSDSLSTDSRVEAKKQKRDATASRLPADWEPSDEDVTFCVSERKDLDPKGVADRFRDYWHAQPGQKGRKIDWSATWRNWVRNERPAVRGSPAGARVPRKDDFSAVEYGTGGLL